MLKNCKFCSSEKVKISKTYSDMWYCSNCGGGDYLSFGGKIIYEEEPQKFGYVSVNQAINLNLDKKVLVLYSLRVLIEQFSKNFNCEEITSRTFRDLNQMIKYKDQKTGLWVCSEHLVKQGVNLAEILDLDVIIFPQDGVPRFRGVGVNNRFDRTEEIIFQNLKNREKTGQLKKDLKVIKIY